MKKLLKKYLIQQFKSYKKLVPARVKRIETLIIEYPIEKKAYKICTIKYDDFMLIPFTSKTKVFNRFFLLHDILKNFFYRK